MQYIRRKNNLRFGGRQTIYIKFPDEISCDDNLLKNFIDFHLYKEAALFKMKLNIIRCEVGLCDDDFINALHTMRFTYKKI